MSWLFCDCQNWWEIQRINKIVPKLQHPSIRMIVDMVKTIKETGKQTLHDELNMNQTCSQMWWSMDFPARPGRIASMDELKNLCYSKNGKNANDHIKSEGLADLFLPISRLSCLNRFLMVGLFIKNTTKKSYYSWGEWLERRAQIWGIMTDRIYTTTMR